jgi:hypothetical protein
MEGVPRASSRLKGYVRWIVMMTALVVSGAGGTRAVDGRPRKLPEVGVIFRFWFPLSEVNHKREGWIFSREPMNSKMFLTSRGSGTSLRAKEDVQGYSSLMG